jgi:hypothetical protein
MEVHVNLAVSATRHPTVPRRLLVAVHDQDGPVTGLSQQSFRVFAYAWETPPPPGYFNPAGRFDVPVIGSAEVATGFYALETGLSHVRIGEDSEEIGADYLVASVFGISVTDTHANTGAGIATRPLGG